jgi:maltooligosyltrehalose trehalohydrolase
MTVKLESSLGARYLGGSRCQFLVWVPLAERVDVHIVSPRERVLPLEKGAKGYYHGIIDDAAPGTRYLYRLDGQNEFPDPVSSFQPGGVHGPSQLIDPHFPWEDSLWSGIPLPEYIIYELHVGTFTSEGTFEAIIPYLDHIKELGITAIELMPVAQFPGERNWGYDGVHLFAVQNSYGGPEGLKRLVDACHQRELALILDVVYNHFGPEGNNLEAFGHYFTNRYQTPWGKAINFDGPHSDEVRRFFIENALYWITEFHIDALRLDALHAILDTSAYTFLEELASAVHEQAATLKRQIYLIGESSDNDIRLISPAAEGGYGLDAQWNDDFHHSLHALLTGEQTGYYEDFGQLQQLVKAFREGFVYSGEYSMYRQRRHGVSSKDIPAHRFVVFSQNHDQVGNRARGERLSQIISSDGLKLAAGIVLLSPYIPLLFMGEEYGEKAPFPYFIHHSEHSLIEAVKRGRWEEFAAFKWEGELPDPQDQATFIQAKLNHDLGKDGKHRILLEFYKELIRLRKEMPPLSCLNKDTQEALGYEESQILYLRRWNGNNECVMVFNFAGIKALITLPIPAGSWEKRLDSAEKSWLGNGSAVPEQLNSPGEVTLELMPKSFILLTKGA